MKLALIQFAPVLCDRDETVRRLDPLFARCGPADLIVLPELANSGYNFTNREEAWGGSESIGASPFLDYLRGKCAEFDCEIVTGLNERAGDRLYNSAVLLSADGVQGFYRKMHLFVNEPDYFEAGDVGLPVFEREYGTIGILICFDWRFCEAWRTLALKGAELICHPSNIVTPHRAEKAIPVHAMINRVFTATANRTGTERDLTFTGRSLIADPDGTVIAQAPAEGEEVLMVEIDLGEARNKAVTARNDAFADRRPEEYGEICRVSESGV